MGAKSCDENLMKSEKKRDNLFLILARWTSTIKEDYYLIGEALQGLPKVSYKSAVNAALRAGLGKADIDIVIETKLQELMDPELVMELYNRIPKESVALQKTGLEVCRQAAQIMRDRKTNDRYPGEYIEILNNYTNRLLLARQVKVAKSNADLTFEFAAMQYEKQPLNFFAHYVDALESRAVIHFYQGDIILAIEDRQRAIEILDSHDGYPPRKLVGILNNHAGVLFAAEKWDKALQTGTKAVDICQAIYDETKPTLTQFDQGLEPWVDDCRPDLGLALIALSTYQNKIGDISAADLSSSQALEIFKKLNAKFPDQFSHSMAQAHNNRAMSYSGQGDHVKVVEELESAAGKFEELVKIHLVTYAEEYIVVLKNLFEAKLKNDDRQGAAVTYQILESFQRKLMTEAK